MIENVFLSLAFFVCPLLFFTDLTRNPYFTQIALLNIFIMGAVAAHGVRSAREGLWRWPRTPLDAPWAGWLAVCFGTWALGWWRHQPFLRPSIFNEGFRVALFTVVNCFAAYWAGAAGALSPAPPGPEAPARGASRAPRRGENGAEPSEREERSSWAVLALAFGGAWLLFSGFRGPAPGDAGVWSRVWEPYGALVWAFGAAAAAAFGRRGGAPAFFHLALAAGLVASGYGVLQYFNVELVWPKVLNPYGGRSVSTFGNPNFLSTYIVLLLPLTALHFLREEGRRRWLYAGAGLLLTSALLASLTRSSWIGAAVALAALFAWPEARKLAAARPGAWRLLAAVAALVLLWPASPVEGYRASALGRILESARLATSGDEPYAPWHQRLLIWSCAWLMGLESPWTGKGWGLLELFYPFYQGPMMAAVPIFRTLRTHANNAHNEVLEIFSQAGIVGLGAYAWLWFAFFKTAVRGWSRPADAFWTWGLAAGLLGMLADNLLNVSIHFAVPAFVVWWAVGAASGRLYRERPLAWRPRPLVGWSLAGGLLAAFAAVSWLWIRQWNREVRYFQGFKLVRQGRLDAAARELRAAYDWHPAEVNNDYELGNALARLERHGEAVWAYGEALKANAGYDEIYFNLATVLAQKQGKWDEGEGYYRMAAWINPLSKEASTGLAAAYLRDPKKNKEEARRLLERAAELFPADASFPNNLGYLHSLTGDAEAARRAYEAALRRDPDFELAERNLRATLRGGGSPLLAALEERRRLEVRIVERLVNAETLALAERVAEAFPGDLKARFYRGSVRLALGRAGEGVEDLRLVVNRQPDNVPARLNLAAALAAAGRRTEARSEFETVLKKDPKNETALRALNR